MATWAQADAGDPASAAVATTILSGMNAAQPGPMLRSRVEVYIGPNQGIDLYEAAPPLPRMMASQSETNILFAFGRCPNMRSALDWMLQYSTNDDVPGSMDNMSEQLNAMGNAVYELWHRIVVPSERRPITLIGWSVGGCLAMWWANRLQYRCPDAQIKVLTFGSPRCMWDRGPSFGPSMDICRWMAVNDPVPYIPCHFSESPSYYLALGWAAGTNMNRWNHGGPGLVFTREGTFRWQNLPPTGVLPPGIAVEGWALSYLLGERQNHDIDSYATWLTPFHPLYRVLTPTGEPIVSSDPQHAIDPPAPPIPASWREGRGTVPPKINAFDAATVAPGQGNPFYPAKQGSQWYVWHWNNPIVTCRTRREATKTARSYNQVVAEWLRADQGDHDALLEAIDFEMPAE